MFNSSADMARKENTIFSEIAHPIANKAFSRCQLAALHSIVVNLFCEIVTFTIHDNLNIPAARHTKMKLFISVYKIISVSASPVHCIHPKFWK
jgi:hypothetical protein